MSATSFRFTGIDPGIVHSGIVTIGLYPRQKTFTVDFDVIEGLDTAAIASAVAAVRPQMHPVFIEKYRPRSNLQHDNDMVAAVNKINLAVPESTVLNNTGMVKVVRRPLMELLDVWKFPQQTHHQDLRAAARIGIYGALKDPDLNSVITGFVRDHTEHHPWIQL